MQERVLSNIGISPIQHSKDIQHRYLVQSNIVKTLLSNIVKTLFSNIVKTFLSNILKTLIQHKYLVLSYIVSWCYPTKYLVQSNIVS